MQTYIALFRAINVLGKNLLPMKDLKSILEKLGVEEIKTYIQSGNVVFNYTGSDITDLSKKITAAIKRNHSFEPNVILLKKKDIQKAVANNPFPQVGDNHKTLHVYFLESKPTNPNLEKMLEIKSDMEQYEIIDKFFYLYTPGGFGKSKLADRAEKLLGVSATARNWRTVNKILEMISEAG